MVAEEIHAGHIAPWLVGGGFQKGELAVRSQLRDGGGLFLGRDVVVKYGFLLGGVTVTIVGVLACLAKKFFVLCKGGFVQRSKGGRGER